VTFYEYPFNERLRNWLRLEHLLRRLGEMVRRTHPLDHHFALMTLFDIVDFTAREDFKTPVLKMLERKRQQWSGLRDNPAISQKVLSDTLAQLERCLTALSRHSGKMCQSLMDNDWLMGIRNRMGISAGTCSFDLPSYHAWQQCEPPQRQRDLIVWASDLAPLADAVTLLLRLMRRSGTPQQAVAEGGQFQKTLPQGRSFQFVRVALDPALGMIPEISANHIMLSVRLMHWESGHSLLPCSDDTPFEFTLCA